jgi:hypothetical protein
MTKTYTVFDIQNPEKVYAHGLPPRAAMNEVIWCSHADWLLIKVICDNKSESDYWQLYLGDRKYMDFYPTQYFAFSETQSEAELEIAEKIIAASCYLETGAAAVEDISYEDMMQNLEQNKK